ncbi:hypothetical protein P1X14_00835 [Sphingomonas sp. AOB5]|uniref:hypothetical protein n=1 Tax=Sphingomonas sp. AOB5 TaxID=3034017 RepID=UPI0023F7AC3E|nr:hypothetical protein [Sphingomonas sp. AOB5]MDF7773777.1 hypothetical protein [Sphingomonas sp. AOB5]
MGPFEVSKELVAALSDMQLRSLLRLLLEAEARTRGIAPAAISVGGNQTAADSGVDAAIVWTDKAIPNGWLPRRKIYYQCKAQVMPPAAIRSEMRPGGAARAIFEELAEANGAYIIVSTDDVSHSAHARRVDAMGEALEGVPGAEKIHTDFLGADSIARWVNQHLGIAVWVLRQAGRDLGGWRPAGDWSAPGAAALPYLFDESRRAILQGRTVDIRTALGAVREILAKPGGIVRLVGLSGMGKTRFAEVLFDGRIAKGSELPAEQAIYGDAGLELAVGAPLLAEQLVLANVKSVIIVDNCTSRAHAQLAEIVSRKQSQSSLLTIDYDIESDPTLGEFVRLDDNSPQLIANLLGQRQPGLGYRDYERLAHFAGGNARIALKIAEGARGGDLSRLRDSQLLDRLFRTGRGEQEPGLRRSAEIAALVYAFYVEAADGETEEHPSLAAIDALSEDVLYRHVATLLDWGVVQQRGPQRAVMPPALANMLAAPFLRRSDPARLLQRFLDAPPRLLASFARRLGELRAEPAAQRIAEMLLAAGGALENPGTLDGNGLRGFIAIAPWVPVAALRAIERMQAERVSPRPINLAGQRRYDLARLLARIGYDDRLFDRAMAALVELWVGATEDERRKVTQIIQDMLRPFAEATMAAHGARQRLLDRLLHDRREEVRRFGLEVAEAMLMTNNFGRNDQSFEQRIMTPAWSPEGPEEDHAWFDATYRQIRDAAARDPSLAGAARATVCASFSNHADRATADLATAAMRELRPEQYWLEGWLAAAADLAYMSGRKRQRANPGVRDLERALRPDTPVALFETFVCRKSDWGDDTLWRMVTGEAEPDRRAFSSTGRRSPAEQLGEQLATGGASFTDLMRRCDKAQSSDNLRAFGAAFAKAATDPEALWVSARYAFTADSELKQQVQMLAGLIQGIAQRDQAMAESWLDQAAADPALRQHLIALHLSIGLNEEAVRRIVAALSSCEMRPDQISMLIDAKNIKLIPAVSRASFLDLIYRDSNGVYPAIALLCSYFFGLDEGAEPEAEMVRLAKSFLCNPRTYADGAAGLPSAVADLARWTPVNQDRDALAAAICVAVMQARPDTLYILPSFQALGTLLTRRYPEIVLEEILAKDAREDVLRIFFSQEVLAEKVVLRWLEADAPVRSLLLAKVVPMTAHDAYAGEVRWSTLATACVAAAPQPERVLRIFRQRVFSGSGNLTARLIEFRMLVASLTRHSDPRVRLWAETVLKGLERHISRWDASERAKLSRFE